MRHPIPPEGNHPLTWLERQVKPLTPAPEGTQPPANVFGFVWFFARQVLGPIIIASILGLFEVLADLLIPISLGVLVGLLADPTILEGGDRLAALRDDAPGLVFLLVMVLFIAPTVFISRVCFQDLAILPGFSHLLRWQAHNQLMKQDLSFFSNDFAGRLSTRVMQLGYALRDVVLETSGTLFYNALYILGAIGILGYYSLWLTLPVIIWVMAFSLLLWRYLPEIQRRSRAHSDMRSELTGRIVDSYTNIQTLKLFADTDQEQSYVAEALDQANFGWVRVMRSSTWLIACLSVAGTLMLVSSALIALWLWVQGSDQGAALATAIPLTLIIMNNSGHLFWVLSGIVENVGTVAESTESIAATPKLVDVPHATPLHVTGGRIEFEAVQFTYSQTSPVIKGLNLQINPGERIGLIGSSGAGKSTLVNLLLRFFDPQSGRILIDGQDIGTVTQASLRGSIAMVTQDTSLLHRSIRDNIRFGRPDASEAEILAAAAKAKVADFLPDLHDHKNRTGLDAHVGERGVKLSGGQRQRIALARLILKDAPILVLDEATSALDSEVEAEIQQELVDLMQRKTVIAIAHRLSTIAQLDRLVVLDQGQIVETGTHADLLAKGGTYARLWNLQSGGFLNL